MTRDASLALQPELAESWTAAPDGWTFNLRKGVKFHGGEDFTAEDVVFSFARAMEEASDFKEQAKNVASVEVIDDYTVKLVTDGPNPILPNQLTGIMMMDSGWAEANNVTKPQDFKAKEESFAARNTNGTGPFILASRAPDELTVLEAQWRLVGQGAVSGQCRQDRVPPDLERRNPRCVAAVGRGRFRP